MAEPILANVFTYNGTGGTPARAGSGNLDSRDKWNFCLTSA